MAIQKTEKEQRAAEAKKHLGAVKGLFETEIKESLDNVEIHEDGDGRELEIPEARFESTYTATIWKPISEALEHASASDPTGRVCVVAPIHFTRPSGAYLDGGRDPESQLCADSSLPAILGALWRPFYRSNRTHGHGGLNSDRAAYIPGVVFTTGGVMKKRDVLAISPVNRKMALKNNRSAAECDQDMTHRIHALLHIAAYHGVDVLVVNDFGCGFMGNDAKKTARIFSEWIEEHPGVFEKVLFAISGGPSLDAFKQFFPIERSARPKSEDAEAKDKKDEQGFDNTWTDVKQTSPGRWVFD